MTHRSKSLLISRRAFAASLLASCALGIGVGELAAPLAPSQAQVAVAAKAPAACASFATNVGHGFTILGTILEDAAKYPPLIAQAYSAGLAHNSSKMNSIVAAESAITKKISVQGASFSGLKGTLLKEELQCLS